MRVNLDKLEENCGCHKKAHSGFYKTEMQVYDTNKWHHLYTIPYGGRATCMRCGRFIDEYEDRSSLVLYENCAPGTKCACCGRWISDEEMFYADNCDEPICADCWDNETILDNLSERVYLDGDSNLYELHWAPVTDDTGDVKLNRYNDPVFYYRSIMVYDHESNASYNAIFNAPPKKYVSISRYGSYIYNYYVTNDMIKDMPSFEDAFYLDDDFETVVARYKESVLVE